MVLAVACGSPANAPAASPTGTTATAIATVAVSPPSPSPSPTASPTPTPRPNPTAGPATYTSVAFAYRIDLPAGWRPSACQSSRIAGQLPGVETFTTASVEAEGGTDIGPSNDVVTVRIEDDPTGQTALAWLESGKLGFSADSHFEKTTFDGTADAARLISTDGAVVGAYVVHARGRIYATTRGLREPTAAAEAAARTLMTSLHILSDAELAEAQAAFAAPPAIAARSAEDVADAVARGFAQKDTAVLAAVASACLTTGAEQAGASFRSAATFLADLQKSFANGLAVTVEARPIDLSTPAPAAGATIRGTWKEPGQAQRNVKLMLTRVEQTWYWDGVLYLQR